jgi:hypothetical protein
MSNSKGRFRGADFGPPDPNSLVITKNLYKGQPCLTEAKTVQIE